MKIEAVQASVRGMQRFKAESDIADYIKTEFDSMYGGDWHCIVGRNFGSSITPQDLNFIYLRFRDYSILLFK